jgi:hypothetical protein
MKTSGWMFMRLLHEWKQFDKCLWDCYMNENNSINVYEIVTWMRTIR